MPILGARRGDALPFNSPTCKWLNTPKDALVAREDPFDYVRRLTLPSVGRVGLEIIRL